MKTKPRNKGAFSVKSIPVDPTTLPQPDNVKGFVSRGIGFYARKDFEKSLDDFAKALKLDGLDEDAFYGTGMVLKAMGRKEEAIRAFQEVIRILGEKPDIRHDRREMLRRLALGHINEIRSGDWNLEKEIWKHIP